MSKRNDAKVFNWEGYYELLRQGKIATVRPKTAQEIEAEKLMNQCVEAARQGKPFS